MGLLKWLGLDDCKKEPFLFTDDNFAEQALKSEIPVAIIVWSETCPTCKTMVPTFMKLACEYEGRIKVGHLNASANRRTVGALDVRGTPTVVIFDGGREIERVVGVRGIHYFEEMFEGELLAEEPTGQDSIA